MTRKPPSRSPRDEHESGRADGHPDLHAAGHQAITLKQVLSEDMQIREGGRLRRMPAMEALVRTLRARAFKGDPKALASLILLARLSGLTESDEAIADLLHGPEYDAIIADFLARNGIENAASDEAFNAPASPIATPAKREGWSHGRSSTSPTRIAGCRNHRVGSLCVHTGIIPNCVRRPSIPAQLARGGDVL